MGTITSTLWRFPYNTTTMLLPTSVIIQPVSIGAGACSPFCHLYRWRCFALCVSLLCVGLSPHTLVWTCRNITRCSSLVRYYAAAVTRVFCTGGTVPVSSEGAGRWIGSVQLKMSTVVSILWPLCKRCDFSGGSRICPCLRLFPALVKRTNTRRRDIRYVFM